MTRTIMFLSLAALLLVPARADEPEQQRKRPAAEVLSAGVDQAREQGKAVFLLFGAPS